MHTSRILSVDFLQKVKASGPCFSLTVAVLANGCSLFDFFVYFFE